MTEPEKWKAEAWKVVVQHPWSPGRFEREGDAYLFSWIIEVASAAYAEGERAEQEACAKLVHDYPTGSIVFCKELAAALRARSNPHG